MTCLPEIFSLCTSCSEQNVAELPGYKNAYVFITLFPLMNLTCTGRMDNAHRSLLTPVCPHVLEETNLSDDGWFTAADCLLM